MRYCMSLFTIVIVVTISLPRNSEAIYQELYQGDGKLSVIERNYGVATTYGYNIEFSTFFANRNTNISYNLINLPVNHQYKDQYSINFEIVLATRGDEKDINDIPKEHEISFELVNNVTSKTIRKGISKLDKLEQSHHYEYQRTGAKRIRNLFDVSMDEISSTNDLTLSFEYSINEKPSLDSMFILVTLMAPTL